SHWALLQESQQCALLLVQPTQFDGAVGSCQPRRQRSIEESLDHAGMHVTSAADRRRVAELSCDLPDGFYHYFLAIRASDVTLARRALLAQKASRQHRAGPGSKILGGKIFARDFLEIGVHIGGIDSVRFALFIDVLE